MRRSKLDCALGFAATPTPPAPEPATPWLLAPWSGCAVASMVLRCTADAGSPLVAVMGRSGAGATGGSPGALAVGMETVAVPPVHNDDDDNNNNNIYLLW